MPLPIEILRLYKPDFILYLRITILNSEHIFIFFFCSSNILLSISVLSWLCWVLDSEVSNLDRAQVPN